MALGSPPQFNNYFLNPYLSGTYGYETYKPYDNLFLNSSLLTQDIMSRKEQAGPINNAVGSSILGGGLFNQLFGSGQPTAGPVFAPFGSPPPANLMGGYGGGQAPSAGGGIGASLDKLIKLLEGLNPSADTPAVDPPADPVVDTPADPVVDMPADPVVDTATDPVVDAATVDTGSDNSDLKGILATLLQVLTGGGQAPQQQGYGYGMPQQGYGYGRPQQSPMNAIMGMNPFSGGGGVPSFNTGSFGNPFSFMANPMSLFGGLGGNPNGSMLAGSNPLPSFSPDFGIFSNSPNQNPGFSALATLDPVIRSSIFSEIASPIFGNILANGGIPPFRSQFFN